MRDSSQYRSIQTNVISPGDQTQKSDVHNSSGLSAAVVVQQPTERDPLLATSRNASANHNNITRRHRSPTAQKTQQIHHQQQQQQQHTTHDSHMIRGRTELSSSDVSRQQNLYIPPLPARGQNELVDSADSSLDYDAASANSSEGVSRRRNNEQHEFDDFRQQYYNERAARLLGDGASDDSRASNVEVPIEIFTVRQAALTVMEPLVNTWLILSIGFALTTALGMARWTNLLPKIPFWLILFPSWLSHAGILVCHIMSARALSSFISAANENRQSADSTDHLDRTEYLPLLQRSLKFGLKTGLLSFCVFIFEVLLYLRLAHGNISLSATLTPIWILVISGILDGIICKQQHILRLLCWCLAFTSMLLAVLKVDSRVDVLRWRVIFCPTVALLSISTVYLIYIVYGHQVGYFRLTESQLTAGILYSVSTLVSIVLVIVLGEVIPANRSVELEIRLFITTLAPLVVSLVGLGAWAVSRDEFDRLLQCGGQAAVHPMKLRLEAGGWTSAECKGITIIPLFGEVSFEPLDSRNTEAIELCSCCACYPYEEDDDSALQYEHRTINAYPGISRANSATQSVNAVGSREMSV